MFLLAIDWSSVATKTGQFILSFSILVVLHELGHFIPARIFKCRVEKFYLFFNPWFSLWKKKIGETEYGFGWVPFGGYVKISGMIDESMDKEQLKLPPQPYEFRAKKAWQRLIIMIGGVVVNVLLAILIFIGIMWKWGEEYLPAKNLKYGVYADSLAKSIGIKDGDKIISVGGKTLENFNTLEGEMMLNDPKTLEINRDGKEISIAIPDGFIKKLSKNHQLNPFADARVPIIIDSISTSAVFSDTRLQKGDTVIAVNGNFFKFYDEFLPYRKKYKDSLVVFTALRGTDTVKAKYLIKSNNPGMFYKSAESVFGTYVKAYSFTEAIPAGFHKCFQTLDRYITGLKQLFTGKVNASDSLGSVISIGNTFPSVWDWERFWTLTAIFSIILAFMNILPIPALDGGHALFTLVEMITGRKPSDKFMEYAQMVGMILLFSLMAYALGLDFWRLFK